jgi:Inner membrane protein YgaP-like, transmembrane domain
MKLERTLRAIAGIFVLISVALAALKSHYWLILTGLVGLNLFQSAFSNWCPMMVLLQKLGMKTCQQEIEALKMGGAR